MAQFPKVGPKEVLVIMLAFEGGGGGGGRRENVVRRWKTRMGWCRCRRLRKETEEEGDELGGGREGCFGRIKPKNGKKKIVLQKVWD